MSWQAYIDTSLVGAGTIEKGAIYNTEGTSCWATSANFNITPEEMAAVVKAIKDDGDATDLQANGLHIAGVKYFFQQVDESETAKSGRKLIGIKGKDGVIIGKTTQALVIARYKEPTQPGSAMLTLSQLTEYLIGVGY